jgi:hypothetical protein
LAWNLRPPAGLLLDSQRKLLIIDVAQLSLIFASMAGYNKTKECKSYEDKGLQTNKFSSDQYFSFVDLFWLVILWSLGKIPSPIFIFKTLTFFVFKPKENGWWMEFSWRRYQCRALGNEIIHARSGREVPRKIDWRPRPRVATKRSKDVAIKKHIKDGKSGKDAFHKIAKDRKVIPDPIDDRKFQEWK